jgi:thiamine biosynthesis lipoprotein
MQAIHRTQFHVMGTTASIHVNDTISAAEFEDLVSVLALEMERLEQMFSVYRESSEVNRINRGEVHLLDSSPEILEVLDHCAWLESASGGAFTVRDPNNSELINPTGFVKGWATQCASRIFDDSGLQHWYIGVGGDFICRGGLTDVEPWRIGIIDPDDATKLVGEVEVFDGAVATSGTAERGDHIWDAHGDRPRAFRSVTVTGPSLMWADAYATTVFAMGDAGPQWLSQFGDYSCLTVPLQR